MFEPPAGANIGARFGLFACLERRAVDFTSLMDELAFCRRGISTGAFIRFVASVELDFCFCIVASFDANALKTETIRAK